MNRVHHLRLRSFVDTYSSRRSRPRSPDSLSSTACKYEGCLLPARSAISAANVEGMPCVKSGSLSKGIFSGSAASEDSLVDCAGSASLAGFFCESEDLGAVSLPLAYVRIHGDVDDTAARTKGEGVATCLVSEAVANPARGSKASLDNILALSMYSLPN